MVDRLSVLDATFLQRETSATPMHTGGLGIFGPELRFETVLATLRERVERVPLARKRLTGEGGARPFWVDDADFDLTYHLRHGAIPPPGDTGQLCQFLSRLLARPLDRDRPLWELYVIEGLEGGRVAVFRKAHLAMAGGDRGDPFAVLLDDSPARPQAVAPEAARWEPEPPPDPLRLRARALVEDIERTLGAGVEVGRVVTRPARLGRALGAAVTDAVGLLGRVTGRAPRSPLNRRLSPHRRLALVHADLDDLRAVRRALGCTVNDVVVTVVADAIGRLLRWRGHDTTDLDLRAMVPVRVHGDPAADGGGLGAAHTVGDGVVGVLVTLPVMRIDPVARLYRVMGELAGLKESRQAVAANDLVRLAGFAPPNLHSVAARLVSGEERYNLALSNAPGPQDPRWLAGVRMEATYPFLPLAGDSALSVAVTSYAGGVFTGLVGERDAVPDLDLLAGFCADALADLRAAAAKP